MWKHIETYITDHRSELDRDTPPSHLWDKIQLDLDEPATNPVIKRFAAYDSWMRIAAAVVLIFGGAWLWMKVVPQPQQPASSLLPVIHQIQDASQEWSEAEAAYVEEISRIMGELQEDWEHSPLYQSLHEDIQQVESELNEIRKAHDSVFQKDSLLNELKSRQQKHLGYLKQLME